MTQKIGANRHFGVIQLNFDAHKCIIVYEEGLQKAVPLVKEGLLKSSKLLSTKNDLIINVSSTKNTFIKNDMGGVTAFTMNEYTMFLSINENATKWRHFLIGTVAHEFNHLIRFQRIGQSDKTLMNNIVAEGLAQCFEYQLTGSLRPWSTAITRNRARVVWAKLKRKLNHESRDLYERLFLKRNDKEFPHWSGYTIGYFLMEKRLGKSEKDWEKVMSMKSKTIIGDGTF